VETQAASPIRRFAQAFLQRHAVGAALGAVMWRVSGAEAQPAASRAAAVRGIRVRIMGFP